MNSTEYFQKKARLNNWTFGLGLTACLGGFVLAFFLCLWLGLKPANTQAKQNEVMLFLTLIPLVLTSAVILVFWFLRKQLRRQCPGSENFVEPSSAGGSFKGTLPILTRGITRED